MARRNLRPGDLARSAWSGLLRPTPSDYFGNVQVYKGDLMFVVAVHTTVYHQRDVFVMTNHGCGYVIPILVRAV